MRYGERWARFWLDLARYADTAGYEGDPDLPHAWRYRDYVIDPFNHDKPYNDFIIDQIAGTMPIMWLARRNEKHGTQMPGTVDSASWPETASGGRERRAAFSNEAGDNR